jgi:hypothetical protein
MSLTEQWVRLYTAGLPEQLRRERRDEIASDVFEQYADGAGRRAVVGRTVRGAVDDLIWRREVARGMKSTTSVRAALTQAWWAPFAALVLLFDIGFAGAVLADDASTMPGRVVGPALVLLAAACLAVGLWARVDRAGASGPRHSRYAAVAIVAAFVAAATTGGLVLLVLAAVTVVAALAVLARGSVRSAGATDALVLVGMLPALAMFWLIVPALLALAVIVGVLTSRPRTAPPTA